MANYIKVPSNHTFNTITNVTATATGDEHGAHLNFGYNHVESGNVAHIIRLPCPKKIGSIIYFNVVANGCELRVEEGSGRQLSINSTAVTDAAGLDNGLQLLVDPNSFVYGLTTSLNNWDIFIMATQKKDPD